MKMKMKIGSNIVIVVGFLLVMAACEEPKSCYDCVTTSTLTHNDGTVIVTKSNPKEVCDMTETEIRSYERDNGSYSPNHNFSGSIVEEVSCTEIKY
jgi:hypothetical protein